jgi:hypothetical protein
MNTTTSLIIILSVLLILYTTYCHYCNRDTFDSVRYIDGDLNQGVATLITGVEIQLPSPTEHHANIQSARNLTLRRLAMLHPGITNGTDLNISAVQRMYPSVIKHNNYVDLEELAYLLDLQMRE